MSIIKPFGIIRVKSRRLWKQIITNFTMGLLQCESALEIFWQMCARNYGEQMAKLTVISIAPEFRQNLRAVNRSTRQKISALEHCGKAVNK